MSVSLADIVACFVFSQLNQETLYWCKANKYYVIILFVMRIIDVITIGTLKSYTQPLVQ